jgi:ribosomal protein L7/L12
MDTEEVLRMHQRISDLEARVARLEGGEVPVAADDRGAFAPTGPASDPEIIRHLAEGHLINAIKRYRELTGAGLAEAKFEVERMQSGVRLT